MNQLITEKDCGTKQGIDLDVEENDVLDRHIAGDIRMRGPDAKHNTLLTPKVQSELIKAGKKTVKVRSPLRCESKDGICQKCAGLKAEGTHWDVGTNIGIISGHSIGEPAVQLSMRVFHTGGLAKGKGADTMGAFKALSNLLRLPANLPNKATLSDVSGEVTKINARPQGGFDVFVGKTPHYVPANLGLATDDKGNTLIKKGMKMLKVALS